MNANDKKRWKLFRWQVAMMLIVKHKWKPELTVRIAILKPRDDILLVKAFNQGINPEEAAFGIAKHGVESCLKVVAKDFDAVKSKKK
jgi:hypothetical protein